MIFFKRKKVELGEGAVYSYTIFECKRLFSIILYNWQTIEQNRFHSHAFPAIAFLLRGKYEEEVLNNGKVVQRTVNGWLRPRFLPRNYTHRILRAAPRTWTLVFTGPWQRYWYEFFHDTNTWVKYTWGRKVVRKSSEFPPDLLNQ